jgi:hypothetical protein
MDLRFYVLSYEEFSMGMKHLGRWKPMAADEGMLACLQERQILMYTLHTHDKT